MAKHGLISLVALLFIALFGSTVAVAEPSLHDVYQAANAGQFDTAQKMMHEVLLAHPKSGKAHYVEAELLAKQGQLKKADTELMTAEHLAPGLPFAKSEAVNRLKKQLNSTVDSTSIPTMQTPASRTPQESGLPWGMLLAGFGLITFITWIVRSMNRQNNATTNSATVTPMGYLGQPGGNLNGMSPQPPYGSSGIPGQGFGSQVMGSLATGAAVGAGVVAGEALMRHFISGNGQASQHAPHFDSAPAAPDTSYNDDMGGSDFGINDASSWDDSIGADNDWN